MLNKNVVTFLTGAATTAGGILAARYLESKETREKLVSNVKEIGEKVGDTLGTGIIKMSDAFDSGFEKATTAAKQLREKL